MEWTVLSCAFLAIFLSVSAKPEVSPSAEGISVQPDPAAVLNSSTAASNGFLLMLKQGDSLLKLQFNPSHGRLNEQMTDGDSVLRGRISKGKADVREELREGDDRLREELDNDVARLKGKMEKEQSRLKEEVAEVEAKLKEETTEWKEDYDHLEHRVKQWEQSSKVEVDQLRQLISALQIEMEAKLNETMVWKEDYDQLEHSVKQCNESSKVEVDQLWQQISALQIEMEAKLNETMVWKEDCDHLEHSVKQWKELSKVEVDQLRQQISALQIEMEAKLNETMVWKEDYDHLEHSVKQCNESSKVEVDDLRQQVAALRLELNRTKKSLLKIIEGCPVGWTYHEDFCFFLNKLKYNWDTAKTECERSGGYLAEDSSTSRHEFLTGLICSHCLTSKDVWIGLDDRVKEGVYVWSHSGQRASVNFWKSNQPNNDGDCVVLDEGLWWDRGCEETYHFLCEKPASQ